MSHSLRLLPPLLALTLLTACAGTDPGTPGASPSPSPLTTGPTGKPTASPGLYRGTVVPGVEVGCRILQTTAGSYVILGGDPARLRDGARVTVRGTLDPGTVSICNQGPILQVTEVLPAPSAS
ncbi:hypothetical protein GCM10010123_00270 [Pilimelia anulata]|uniref:Lipoprotein n=1 Tax=Pilimelia anulata TaxID=53371 RepID=A0A8J3B5W8_9ACTN|nr:hypothetical protein [Pilimelia anulata]GGJ74258.1 hypothetical protein GCM10010123_00270 [Pilimelia anulata]